MAVKAPACPVCCACLRLLTREERTYYGMRCERCERALLARIDRWRAGYPDKELDELFNGC